MSILLECALVRFESRAPNDTQEDYVILTSTDEQTIDVVPLYQHSKRERWGLALLAWEGPDKRRYQFQDGKLRTFKKGYYHFFQEVDRPLEETWEVAQELTQKLDLTRARRDRIADTAAKGRKPLTTLDDQLEIFKLLFPEGFDGYTWKAKVRGTNAARRLKAHRQPAIEQAKELLSQERMSQLMSDGDFGVLYDDVCTIGAATDLVRKKADLSAFVEMDEAHYEPVITALHTLLWGEGQYRERFKGWIKALEGAGIEPTWQLATFIPALVHPKEHTCVRPSAFRTQAAWMAPRLKYDSSPTAQHYARYRAMTKLVRKTVRQKSDHRMRDLMDTYEFIVRTLRPSARKLIQEDKQ